MRILNMIKNLFIVFVVLSTIGISGENLQWKIEGGMVFSHFQQQVKRAVGEPRGQRLVNDFQLGGLLSGYYRVHDLLHVGLFVRVDRGERFLAHFNGFDVNGKTQTKDGIGGTYTEVWLGPLVQFQWKQLTFDAGFAPYGTRSDNARGDIPNANNSASGAFSLHPTIAWLFSLGGNFDITEQIDVLMKIEYRPRYYSKRGGENLISDIEHGTQSIAPVLGVAYSF